MTETFESENRVEISTLLDVSRAISPNSAEIASQSRPSSDPTSTEELALTKVLDDNGIANKELLNIFNGTPTGDSLKKYIALEDEGGENPLVEKKRISPNPSRRVIALTNNDGTYRIVRFDKEHNKPFEVDILNAEGGDENITLDEETKKKLDEHIMSQRSNYEFHLKELVKTTY